MLIKKGKLIQQGTPIELIDSVSGNVVETLCSKEELEELQKKYPVHNLFQKRSGFMFRIVGGAFEERFEAVKDDISLEDVFLYYLNKKDI